MIGLATSRIAKGEHVHVHNVRSPSDEELVPFAFETPVALAEAVPAAPASFLGYRRARGPAGVRNYILVVASVNCSATVVKAICREYETGGLPPGVDGVIPVTHAQGCAQAIGGLGQETLLKTLVGWIDHPNVVGAVVIGLGCEGTTPDLIRDALAARGADQVLRFFSVQDTGGTAEAIARGRSEVRELLLALPAYRREACPVSDLRLALNCGGSDGFSALTANPALGFASDRLVRDGAAVVLAEIPECHGAKESLRARIQDPVERKKLDDLFAWWETYAEKHHVEMNNNLAPGNIAGGLTTIVEKSMGAVAKAGRSAVSQVVGYAQPVSRAGAILMNTPGFDPVSVTGLVAGGCQIVAFTTGRGSVYGCSIAPTIKIATNSSLARKMAGDMDIDAGRALEDLSLEDVGRQIYAEVLSVAEGKPTKSESLGIGREEFTPWPVGETL